MAIDLEKYRLKNDLEKYRLPSASTNGFPTQEPEEVKRSFKDRLASLTKGVGNAVTSSEQSFGKALSTVFDKNTAKTVDYINTGEAAQQNKVLDAIRSESNPERKQALINHLKQYYGADYQAPTAEDINPAFGMTNKEVLGSAAGTALDVATAGTYGKAAKTAETGKLLKSGAKVAEKAVADQAIKTVIKPTLAEKSAAVATGALKGIAKNAPTGAAYGASAALQNNEDAGGVLEDATKGAVFNSIVGGFMEARTALKGKTAAYKAQQLHEQAIQQYKQALGATKEKYKQLSDEVVPTLLKEGKWGSRGKLLTDALNGVKLSEEKYRQLGELQGVAEVGGIQEAIQKEINKLKTPNGNILSTETGKYKALKGLQQDISDYVLHDQVAKSGGPVAAQQQLRELAQSYGTTLYDTRKSLKTVGDDTVLSQVQKVDSAIRGLLAKNNPTYADINKVYTHNSRLAEILNETANRESSGRSGKRLVEMALTGLGVAGTIASGDATGAAQGVLGTLTAVGAVELLNSTWWNSLRAVRKEKVARKLLDFDPNQRSQVIRVLARQGEKYARELGITD